MHGLPFVRVAVRGAGTLHRAGFLTPYLAELIADDVLRRPGARLEVFIARGTDADGLRAIHDRMRSLARKGVRIVYRPARRGGAVVEPDAA